MLVTLSRISKELIVLLGAALAAFALLMGTGCTQSTPKAVANVTAIEAMGLIKNDFAVLVDVREKAELESGMAAPAVSMPISLIESNSPEWQEFLAKTSKDKQIITYCLRGVRAKRVAELAAKKGFRAAVMPGIDDWKSAGLPITPIE